jgi:hypothetical protein
VEAERLEDAWARVWRVGSWGVSLGLKDRDGETHFNHDKRHSVYD